MFCDVGFNVCEYLNQQLIGCARVERQLIVPCDPALCQSYESFSSINLFFFIFLYTFMILFID